MSMTEKPFACNEKNCNMTFVNEDHLNSHQKKHTMSFNLELAIKTTETVNMSDQTPTPTSFFRNCEEVGLFQDLQHVNPFEETFKKALENSGNDIQKLICNEDSLHTPHIFPTVDEHPNKTAISDHAHELSIVDLVELPQINESGADVNIKLKDKQDNLRRKLKEVLMKKDKLKNIQNLENTPIINVDKSTNILISQGVTFVDLKNLEKQDESILLQKLIKKSLSPQQKQQKTSLDKVREINRAAQMRCRNKKKRYYDRITKELATLKKENAELKEENLRLRQNTFHLSKIIEQLGGKQPHLANNIKITVLNGKSGNIPVPVKEVNLKKLPVLAPAAKVPISKIVTSTVQPITSPIVYNIVPVQIMNGTSNSINGISSSPTPLSSEVKRRKHVPRILKLKKT